MCDHNITIKYKNGNVICDPELESGVKPGQTVGWTCEGAQHWAVVFGPDAPFVPEVLGNMGGITLSEATVFAKRPGDFHKHKYVAIVFAEGKLVSHDPEVDVEE